MRAPGEHFGRFVVEREAGAGGMGRVYRARDTHTGNLVALKVLHAPIGDAADRFEREVRVLSKLAHPNIVRYVDHGIDEEGAPWLAMEWLEGESLARTIARDGPLSHESTLRMGVAIAAALGSAHAARILHRDIKPQNLLVLPTGDVKVLDFGIARRAKETISLTRTGVVVGSFHYMSPEQALGSVSLTPASDVFSLGCVLYECVTGKRAFFGHDATAVLAKILLDQPQPIHELRSSTPPALVSLIERMLAKDPEDRPSDGLAAAEELSRIAIDHPSASLPPPSVKIGETEQRVVCVVLAKDVEDDTRLSPSIVSASIDTAKDVRTEGDALRETARSHGGSFALLADGCAIVTFEGADAPTRAARCALETRRHLPHRPIVLSMGLGVMSGRAPIGEGIELAVEALASAATDGVQLAGAIEGVLGAHFEIRSDGVLLAAKSPTLAARKLLGKETSCVGRERELRALEALFEECVSESSPRAALVTGEAGLGKTRLWHELSRRLDARILVGRGDALGAGSPFSILSDAVRRAAGIADAPEDALAAHVEDLLSDAPAHVREQTTAFLGEMCGIVSSNPIEALRAARNDARAMGDAMRRAFEHWLSAHARRAPTMLVLEDLHWGDLPTVRFVDAALRNLTNLPFMVLALARPEVEERFPALWKEHALLRLALGPLSKKAQEKLVGEVLGEASEEAIERITARSEGNAFFLEELIRSEREQPRATTVPQSVLAMVQARLDAIDADARRVLRAASIFGERFTKQGASVLARDANVDAALEKLVALEIITPLGGDDPSYVFRHALVRETAYALLTDEDRRLGHLLAAEFLLAQGERDAALLATHFERGGQPERASGWLLRAAHQALGGADLAKVLELAGRARASANEPDTIGRLCLVQAEAHRWRGEMDEAVAHASRATELLTPGSSDFYFALGEAIAACAYSGNFAGAAPFFQRALSTPPAPSAVQARIVSIARGCTQMLEAGRYAEVDAIMQQFEINSLDALEDVARGWVGWLFAMRALCAGDLGRFIEVTEKTLAVFERIGETRHVCSQRTNLGYAYAELGDYTRAETQLRQVNQEAERLGLPMLVAYTLHNLGNVVASQGRLDEGLELETRAVKIGASMRDPRIEGASRAYVSKMARKKGDLETAAREADAAIALLTEHPALLAFAHAMRGLVHLERNELDLAMERTAHAIGLLERHGTFEDGETAVRLAHVRVLLAQGDRERAREAVAAAKERLLARAARIADPSWRSTFLERVADSRETLAIAAACDV